MTDPRRAISVLAEQDPAFRDLCEVLYGEAEPEVVYADVFEKRAPQNEDSREKLQRRVATGSNILGLTAGSAAIGATLQDKRLNHVHAPKFARKLYRTGQKIPAPLRNKLKNMSPKNRALAATGAAGLQVANVVGDVVVGATLPKGEKVKKFTGFSTRGTFKVNTDADFASMSGKGNGMKVPSVDALANGAYASRVKPRSPGVKGPTGGIPPFQPGMMNPERNAKQKKIGALLHKPLENKKATAGVVAGGYLLHRQGKKKGQNETLQAFGYSKRDTEIVEKPMPDLELAGTFSKFDDEKRQAFGFASVVKKNGMPVIDRQGDYIDEDEMEKAAYHYVQKSRVGGDMHRRMRDEYGIDKAHHVSDLIESMVFTKEKCQAMGLPAEVSKQLEGHWWVGYQIHDDATWEEVRKKGRTGFSIHGRGKRVETSVDELMGY